MRLSMKRYLGIFAAIYGGAMVATSILVHSLDIDPGSGVNFVMLFAAAYGTVTKFVTDHKRAPDAHEKRKLVLGSLAICWLMSGLGVLLTVVMLGVPATKAVLAQLSQLPTAVWLIIGTVVTLVYYLILSLVYGWVAKKHAEKALSRSAT